MSLARFVVLLRKRLPICFFDCGVTNKLWVDLSTYVSNLTNVSHIFVLKDVIFYYENPKLLSVEYVINFLILNAKLFIHEQKWLKSPFFSPFFFLNFTLVSSLRLTKNKKSATFFMHYDSFSKSM